MDYHTLELSGLTRKLPLIYVGRKTRIASFSILGDVELVNKLAEEVADNLKNKDVDCLVGPEVKVVPLIHGVALRLNHKKFVICRKSIKPYMIRPVMVKPLPHFPKHTKPLVLDGQDAQYLKGKRVVVIDDIISSGVTMRMMKYLMEKTGSTVDSYYTIIKQGEQYDNLKNLTYMAEIPIFKD